MSIAVQEDKKVGLVTLVCDGEWVVVAGQVIGKGSLAASASSSTPQVKPASTGSPAMPTVPLPPAPPPPVFSVVALGPKLLDVKLHKSLKPAFESLVQASEFKKFAGSLNNEFVLTISPAGAKERAKMPTRVATQLGDLSILHRYVSIK